MPRMHHCYWTLTSLLQFKDEKPKVEPVSELRSIRLNIKHCNVSVMHSGHWTLESDVISPPFLMPKGKKLADLVEKLFIFSENWNSSVCPSTVILSLDLLWAVYGSTTQGFTAEWCLTINVFLGDKLLFWPPHICTLSHRLRVWFLLPHSCLQKCCWQPWAKFRTCGAFSTSIKPLHWEPCYTREFILHLHRLLAQLLLLLAAPSLIRQHECCWLRAMFLWLHKKLKPDGSK